MPILSLEDKRIGYDRFDPPDGTPVPVGGRQALLLVPGFTLTRRRWPDGFCKKLAESGLVVVRMDNRDTGDSVSFSFTNVDAGGSNGTDDRIEAVDFLEAQGCN